MKNHILHGWIVKKMSAMCGAKIWKMLIFDIQVYMGQT